MQGGTKEMEKIELKVELREGRGKGSARSIRRAGSIPAVMYGLGGSTPISIGRKELVRIINAGHGASTLMSVQVAGAKGPDRLVILKDFQTDPIRNELLHVDLLEVAADKPVHVNAPVTLSTESPKGVKEGGILQFLTRDLMVECLPGNIPNSIDVDIAELGINESVHVADVKFPEGVKPLTEGDTVIVTIAPPLSAEKLDAMLSSEAAAEVKEPEVVTKGKEKEEAEGGK
jgi:large subunit ribosomal protein L25